MAEVEALREALPGSLRERWRVTAFSMMWVWEPWAGPSSGVEVCLYPEEDRATADWSEAR